MAYAENIRVYDVVIPFSAGGPSDILFRAIEPELNNRLIKNGIKLIIKNITGAGGSIGLSKVIESDKVTFGFFSPFYAINKNIRSDMLYDYDSINFLSFAGYNKMVVISGKHLDFSDLKNTCLKNNTISFGSSGVGSTSHLAGYYFAKKYLKCDNILSVPYRGVSMVYPDLKGGRIDFMADFAFTADTFIQSKYVNGIEEIKETDMLSWHIFVSNNLKHPDIAIVKSAFDSLKKDKQFSNQFETSFHISKFSESRDLDWLKNEFNMYKKVIESLPNIKE